MKTPRASTIFRQAATLLATSALATTGTHAASSLMALETFGTSGWLAPGSNPHITPSNSERGLGWNPVTKNLVLPSRSGGNFVAILDGRTGAVNKTLDTTGVSGGTLSMMGAGVSSDGAIFVANLQSGSSSLSPFKIYKWNSENDTSPPTVAFSKVNPQTTSGAFRYADSFDVHGSGSDVIFAAAGTTTSGTTGGLPNNSNFMIGKLDGTNTSTIYRNITGTLNSSNDYRLGLRFVDADTVIGSQGTNARLTDFSVTTDEMTSTGATLIGSISVGAAERALDYTVINGTALLATINSNSSLMSVYDITDLANVQLLATGSTYTGFLTPNANATGGVQWGEMLSPTSQIVYGMSTNQGIQAMVFTLVPEPSTVVLGALGVLGLVVRRRR